MTLAVEAPLNKKSLTEREVSEVADYMRHMDGADCSRLCGATDSKQSLADVLQAAPSRNTRWGDDVLGDERLCKC